MACMPSLGRAPAEGRGRPVLYMRGMISAMLGVEASSAPRALTARAGHDRRAGPLGLRRTSPRPEEAARRPGLRRRHAPGLDHCLTMSAPAGSGRTPGTAEKWNFSNDWLQADEHDPQAAGEIHRCQIRADKYAAREEAASAAKPACRTASPSDALARALIQAATWNEHHEHPPERQRHRGHLQPRHPGAQGRVAAGARRRHRPCSAATAPARRRRCARSATCSPASAARSPRARSSCAASASRTSTADLVSRGVVQVMEGRHCFAHLTIEENPDDRRLHPPTARRRWPADAGKVYNFSPAEDAPHQPGRLHLRRRAADVRHRPRADGQPEDGAARRGRRWAWRRRSSKRCSTS